MSARSLQIGVDFDNTIVAYDRLFQRIAVEQGLIDAAFPANKFAIRNHLRLRGEEPAWTALQGIVYGPRITEAQPFPGVQEFFTLCAGAGLKLSIISHKTQEPIAGEPFDLHRAAYLWLERWGFLALLPRNEIFFETTREGKLRRIEARRCTHFIDDLPEFLEEPLFPKGVERLLFDPSGASRPQPGISVCTSWQDITTRFGL